MAHEFELTYRGVKVPNTFLDPEIDVYSEGFKAGVDAVMDAAFGTKVPTPEPVGKREYRYFHDNDNIGFRHWVRAAVGSDETTGERWDENGDRYRETGCAYDIEDLLESHWSEASENEAHPRFRDRA